MLYWTLQMQKSHKWVDVSSGPTQSTMLAELHMRQILDPRNWRIVMRELVSK